MHKLREGDNYRLACARVLLEYYILEKDWDCVQFDHTFFRRGGLGGGGGGGGGKRILSTSIMIMQYRIVFWI